VDLVEAFWLLSSSRQVSQGAVSGIALSEIRAYLAIFPQPDNRRFVRIMKGLDGEYLETTRKRWEQRAKGKGER